MTVGSTLQVGQNSQFSEGFDPSVYAAARADLQARKAAKAKAHTGAGGLHDPDCSQVVCCQCGASAQLIKCCLWQVSHTQPYALPLKSQKDAYQKMPLTWICSCRKLSCT